MKRLFLLDPVCILPFGHNAALLTHYAQFAADAYSSVYVVCNKHYPLSSTTEHFHRHFQHLYNFALPVANSEPDVSHLITQHRSGTPLPADLYERVAADDIQALVSEYTITSEDTLFFPSVDYYGTIGALRTLSGLPTSSQPRLLLRFIGVMETASLYTSDCLSILASALREAGNAGLRVSLSAETPAYAARLMEAFSLPVMVVPYPVMFQQTPLPTADLHYVLCAGSSRHDKGFLHLLSIFSAIRKVDPNCAIRFVLQLPPASCGTEWIDYTRRLYALPGVHALPSVVSDAVIRSWYERCSVCLLPYDVDTYRNRGSAVLMEAAALGRPVVTLAGTGFADQVSFFTLGLIAQDVQHMAPLVLEYLRSPLRKRQILVDSARERYSRDAEDNNKRWLL